MSRASIAGIVAFVAGMVAVVLAALFEPGATAQAWLAACLFWIGAPVGALFIVLARGLVGGVWDAQLRPALTDMIRMLPVLTLLVVPLLLAGPLVYPWARAPESGWLDPPFFAARAALYLAAWNGLGLVAPRARPGLAWPALILLFASASLAAFDWIMSLEPHWTSSVFGLQVTVGWALFAMACAVAFAAWRCPAPEADALDPPARLLLALVLLWAYLAAVQFIVIWESDLSHEIPWYLVRLARGWQSAALAVTLLQFLVPFLVLPWQRLRRSRTAVLAACCSVIAGHLMDTWWLTVPDFGRSLGWIDMLAVIAISGFALFVFSLPPRAAIARVAS
jgi:hypothetical protein